MSDINHLNATSEKPRNGIAGLKHWRQDLLAGFVVSLVSLPLSSGIAIASGAPPIYGIISSIIAGLVFPFVGGSFVTISGPAAGLAPALLAIMVSLGGAGDAEAVGAGYHMLLVVIFLTGLLQLVMAKLGLARYAAIFPASVVEGMLAAIGVLILVKALPLFAGFTGGHHAHGVFEYLGQAPDWFARGDHFGLMIAVVTLAVMLFTRSKFASRWALLRRLPPHIFGVGVAIALSTLVGLVGRDPHLLIEVPVDPLSGISLPAFGQLFGDSSLWGAALVGVLTLSLIDGVESLATAQAIDRIDPFKRQSSPDRVLLAMGLSNMVSSLVGGLTVIPGGVKSKTCIEAGGRTLWANFVNAAFLVMFLFVAPALVALIPKAALGAILVYTGWKMAHPSIARHMNAIGREQLFIFFFTIAAILITDLLVGVLTGTAAKLAVLTIAEKQHHPDKSVRSILSGFFKDPIVQVTELKDRITIRVDRPVVSFNSYKVAERIDAALERCELPIDLDLAAGVSLIDHTALEGLRRLESSDTRGTVRIVGLDRLGAKGEHSESWRVDWAR